MGRGGGDEHEEPCRYVYRAQGDFTEVIVAFRILFTCRVVIRNSNYVEYFRARIGTIVNNSGCKRHSDLKPEPLERENYQFFLGT